MNRVIALVDMDCFYVQVEQRRNPDLKGKPCAVVQYNQWKGGGIIAVGYEARAHGVTRQMRGDEAKKKCPTIQLVSVPVNREKADLTRYREAGAEVISVLTQFSKCVERASVDEAYIDLTEEVKQRLCEMRNKGDIMQVDMLPCTHVVGWDGHNTHKDYQGAGTENLQENTEQLSKEDSRKIGTGQWIASLDDHTDNLKLAVGALIAEEMRAAVLEQTGFHCSAGIAHNKSLAKLSCGLNKPRKQTVLPQHSVPILFQTIPLHKVRNLGGKLGVSLVEGLKVKTMSDLCNFTEKELQTHCGKKTGKWLHDYCRGIDDEPVRPRELPKSVGCSKNFTGKAALDTKDKVKYWLHQLSEEVTERLQREKNNNNRIAKTMSLYIRQDGSPPTNVSRSCGLYRINAERIASDAFKVIQSLNVAGNHQAAWSPAIICLGISASKFTDLTTNKNDASSLESFLTKTPKGMTAVTKPAEVSIQKGRIAKKQSLDFFFSPNQNVAKSYEGEQDETAKDTNAVQQIEETNKSAGVKKNNLDCFLSSHQKIQENSETHYNHAQMETSNTGNPMTSSVRHSNQGETTKAKRETFARNWMDKKSSGSCDKGFFAIKLQQKSSKAKMESGSKYDNKQVDAQTHSEGNGVKQEMNTHNTTVVKEHKIHNIINQTNESGKHSNDAELPSTSSCKPSSFDLRSDFSNPTLGYPDDIFCEKCSKSILVWEYPEHLDYHYALEIQKESPIPTVVVSKKQRSNLGSLTDKVAGKRRGRPPGLSSSKKARVDPPGSSSTLHSFFKPK